MNFIDGNKKYSIDFREIHNRYNGVVVAEFILNVSKPFRAKNRFAECDVGTLQGVKGINFYVSSEIAKAIKTKKSVLFSLTEDALNFIESEAEKGKKEIQKIAESKPVKNWVWAHGGDTHNLYISIDELSSLEMNFRADLIEIMKFIEKNDMRAREFLREHSQKIDRKTALYTFNGWNEISNEDLMEIYNILKSEDSTKQAAKDEKKEAIFSQAAQTGERQILREWLEECNDPKEDCSTDNIIQYAMPDGTTETERHHNW